ncbi:hypothetical protein [Chromobacterium violaceum]|uniref:hypothetical protein n=1 Tax=Chromobacterium violaceum TaxID=536 RepID=UPI0005BDE2AA|nr:hypothetical protein [Chromobacterium violaceum]
MPTVLIDGVEYVPRAEVPPLTDERMNACLKELASIQYFSDCPHRHRAWAWDAMNALAPELAELAANNPKAAFERIHGSEA